MRNTWQILKAQILRSNPFLLAGIVNVTPDSFYDGGEHEQPDDAVSCALRLAQEGADILDLGGESTRPGAEPVSKQEELKRVLPVIAMLAEKIQGMNTVISVDTYKAKVAEEALNAGASIVNDISACRFDPLLLDVLVQKKPGYVLMHTAGWPKAMQQAPQYEDVVSELLSFFEERLHFLTSAGLPEENIVLDPGIGFGKTTEHNLTLLRHLDKFKVLGCPVYIGLSNKSVWGNLLDIPLEERGNATASATALAYAKGATIHRVHDVQRAQQALTIASQIFPIDRAISC